MTAPEAIWELSLGIYLPKLIRDLSMLPLRDCRALPACATKLSAAGAAGGEEIARGVGLGGR